jgi:hypothetical protein
MASSKMAAMKESMLERKWHRKAKIKKMASKAHGGESGNEKNHGSEIINGK